MTDRPMIFSGPMVRALLDGRKTQTRRVLKPQPPNHVQIYRVGSVWDWRDGTRGGYVKVPFAIGDRIWVRETWAEDAEPVCCGRPHPIVGPGRNGEMEYVGEECCGSPEPSPIITYRAEVAPEYKPYSERGWRSPIYMPRWASRITLVVTDVRVQRLHEISEEDAISEGVGPTLVSPDGGSAPHVETYIELWNSLNAKRGYPWESNPWVCALTFDVIRQNIDALPTGSAAGM